MATRQPKKVRTFSNLAEARSQRTEDLKAAALFTVSIDGTIEKRSSGAGIFLLNPSGITESKSSSWVQQNTPGQSDPPLQWVSSGARTLSFDALVTKDTSYYVSGVKKVGEEQNPLEKSQLYVGSIASAFSKTATPAKRSVEEPSDTLDISAFLNYYRSLLYPEYDVIENPRRLKSSPPLVVLLMGKSVTKFPYGSRVSSQHDLWVVTGLEIKITKQLPDLSPQEAVVSFKLTQYNIRSFDGRRFLKDDES